MALDLSKLAMANGIDIVGAGEPLLILLEDLNEDPNQPRVHFDKASLDALAESMTVHGIITPLSVRPDPDAAGIYIINDGARRFRAAQAIGMEKVPCVISKSFTLTEQLIANIHREGHTLDEIAKAVNTLMNRGLNQALVARALSFSPTYVSKLVAYLDIPPALKEILPTNKYPIDIVYPLQLAYQINSEAVIDYCKTNTNLTREQAKDLLGRLDNEVPIPIKTEPKVEKGAKTLLSGLQSERPTLNNTTPAPKPQGKGLLSGLTIILLYKGEPVYLDLDEPSDSLGRVWVSDEAGARFLVLAADCSLNNVIL
jgi:ParB family transcriptional regulator, chromosome partitioning protein